MGPGAKAPQQTHGSQNPRERITISNGAEFAGKRGLARFPEAMAKEERRT
jgi:hypothetical protein